MMKVFLTVFQIVLGFCAYTQINISATVLNSETQEPVVFASVLILDVFEGTIADIDGNFALKNKNFDKEIMIQSLGYYTDTLKIEDLKSNKIILLKPKNIEVAEIIILPKNAFDIMRKAVEKIPENYFAPTIAQNVFYRQMIVANEELLSLEEANFDALVKFKNENANLVSIQKARAIIDLDTLKSLGKMVAKQLEDFDSTNIRENSSQFFAMNFMLSDKLGTSSKDLFGEKGYKNYNYSYNGLVEKDGYFAYHLTFDQLDNVKKSLLKGHFYIDTASLAFIDVQAYLSPKGIEYQKVIPKSVQLLVKMFGYTIYIRGLNYNVHYKKIDEKWVMDYSDSKLAAKVSKRNGVSFDGYLKMVFNVNKFYLKEGFYNRKSKFDKLASNPKDFKNTNFWEELEYLPLKIQIQSLIK